MTTAPRALHSLLEQAYGALRAGDIAAAERRCREAVQLAPDDADAMHALALALLLQGKHAEAVEWFERLVQRQPAELTHWSNLGTAQRALGRYDAALSSYQRVAAAGEHGPDFLFNLGVLQIDRGDYEAARVALRDALDARPRDAEIACQYATACSETLHTQEGVGALADWASLDGLTADLVAQIGGVLLSLGDMARAERAVKRALEDPALSPKGLLQAILALERMNRTDRASELLQRLEGADADAPDADLLLARARVAQRQQRHDDAIRLYRQLLERTPEPDRRFLHLFPLAQALDAAGRYEEADAEATAAHDSQDLWIHRTAPEMTGRPRGRMRITTVGCDSADVAGWRHDGAPDRDHSPIFIVAFPRSGTTLLEQMLDAHPRLCSMDEQPFLQSAIELLDVGDAHYPDRMATLTPAQLDAARGHYWSQVRQRVALGPGQLLIDKNPLNILRLPAIARLFPNSRTLLAIRHPLDVVVSCFMQLFRSDFAWHCRDLATLALTYRCSMDYWHEQAALLSPRVREIRYEAFVSDFDQGARDVAAFLELPWTDAMLQPAEHARRKGYISTPSYTQVVQPVHSRSVDRWRRYARYLCPAVAHVQPWLDRWGYAATTDQNNR